MKSITQSTSLTILLADDDKDDCFFFKKALKELPFVPKLSIASDGERLMTYLAENSDKLPDVLFLDINMPRKNGIECLTEIKLNSKLKDIPVIIYSTSAHDDIADMLYEKGAHYYLQKCDYLDLTKNIQGILDRIIKFPERPARDKFVFNSKDYNLN
ncbi:MAG: response regulator [Bacteroidota bacterium]